MASDRSSLLALKNLIADTELILATTPKLPQNRTACCRENLRAALSLVNDLLHHQHSTPTSDAAALMGSKGGSVTSKKFGPDHYRRMAAARKRYAGGRPRKNQSE